MNKRKKVTIAAVVLAVVLIAGVGVYAASSYGTRDDPLVAMSYLEDTLSPEILGDLQKELDAAIEKLSSELGYTAETYKLVTLSQGQSLTGRVGCEVILRSGSAAALVPSSQGLADTTAGTAVSGGDAVQTNHLYMVGAEGCGITATAGSTRVLVRGSYTIG